MIGRSCRNRVAIAAATVMIVFAASPATAQCNLPGDPDAGKAIFDQTCVACHGENGQGAIPGIPNLARKPSPLQQSDELLLQRIRDGYSSGKSPIAMPPMGGNPDLSDSDLLDVLSYMRKTFAC